MMLPMVTGSKLPMKKFVHVNAGKSVAVLPIEAQKALGRSQFDEQSHRDEIHIGDAVLEPGRDERGNRRNGWARHHVQRTPE
jgi:hypothetical protein